jgi:hypothetical protein
MKISRKTAICPYNLRINDAMQTHCVERVSFRYCKAQLALSKGSGGRTEVQIESSYWTINIILVAAEYSECWDDDPTRGLSPLE